MATTLPTANARSGMWQGRRRTGHRYSMGQDRINPSIILERGHWYLLLAEVRTEG